MEEIKNMATFKAYADSGHAWVAVKRSLLSELGVLDKISRFSYQSKTGQTIYLEEDCDAGLFVNAYKEKYNTAPRFVEQFTNSRSPIRSYPQFKP